MRTVAALVLAVVGCGRWNFADHPAGDARAGDAFDPTAQEDDPSLTGDLLEIYFDSDRAAPAASMGDIWVAKRASTADPFGAPTLVSELASISDNTTPEVSADGLTMYFASDRLTANDRDIYVTTRPDRTSAWAPPVRVPELSSIGQDDDSAELLPDGLHMVMSRGMQPNLDLDLDLVTRATPSSPWGALVPLPGLDDPMNDESQQWASPDLTVVYFVSNRPTSNSQDIWLGTRPDAQSSFTITRVTELSTGAQDTDPWLTPDLRTIYFASARTGQFDIYTATR